MGLNERLLCGLLKPVVNVDKYEGPFDLDDALRIRVSGLDIVVVPELKGGIPFKLGLDSINSGPLLRQELYNRLTTFDGYSELEKYISSTEDPLNNLLFFLYQTDAYLYASCINNAHLLLSKEESSSKEKHNLDDDQQKAFFLKASVFFQNSLLIGDVSDDFLTYVATIDVIIPYDVSLEGGIVLSHQCPITNTDSLVHILYMTLLKIKPDQSALEDVTDKVIGLHLLYLFNSYFVDVVGHQKQKNNTIH